MRLPIIIDDLKAKLVEYVADLIGDPLALFGRRTPMNLFRMT